jgi:hypothetical protein
VNGQPKRCFDESAVCRLFADGWNTIALEHITINKYHQPKAEWEAILERVQSPRWRLSYASEKSVKANAISSSGNAR